MTITSPIFSPNFILMDCRGKYDSAVVYVFIPIATILALVLCIINGYINIMFFDPQLFIYPLLNCFISVIVLIYGFFARCCGERTMKFVLSILIIIQTICLIGFGSSLIKATDTLSERFQLIISQNSNLNRINLQLKRLLNSANCNDVLDETCQKKILSNVSTILLHFGYLNIIFGVIIFYSGVIGVIEYNRIKNEARDELSADGAFCCT